MPALPVLDLPMASGAGIQVDARADEEAWAEAASFSGFITYEPVPGKPATHDTTGRILITNEGVHLFIEAHDPEPRRIYTGLGRRDTRFEDDYLTIYLDTDGSAQRAYVFIVNPHGVQSDGIRVAGTNSYDLAWDTIWQSAATITRDGFQVEISIPWRSIRHPADCDQMGLFVTRYHSRLGEKSSWPVKNPNIQGLLLQEARLNGPGRIPRNAGLDLIPEITFGTTQDGLSQDRLAWNGIAPGLSVRYAPSPHLTLMGTANPDFSQVESDSSQIDINRRYALYWEEKRPFFLEGQEWFEDQFGEVIYTRSMDSPYYGARATVESGRWSVAALHVMDATPTESVSEGGGWSPDDMADNPALETVARVRRGMGKDSFLGALFSDRTMLGVDLSNRMGGLDGWVRLSDKWAVSGSSLASWTRFAEGDDRTGLAENLELAYDSKPIALGTKGEYLGPDFRAENGYIVRSDSMGGNTWFKWRLYPDKRVLRRIAIVPLDLDYYWYTGGSLRDLVWISHLDLMLINSFGISLGWVQGGEDFHDTWLPYYGPGIYINGSPSKWLTGWLRLRTGTAPYYLAEPAWSGWSNSASTEMELRPWSHLILGLSGTLEDFFTEAGGDKMYRATVSRAKLELFADRQLWARFIADLKSTITYAEEPNTDSVLQLESLLAWEHAPSRTLYLGGLYWFTDPVQWQVFAKASWVFQL